MAKQKYLGYPYPITTHARGFFHTQFGSRQIKSDLLALLLTNQGSRVMLPNYGAGLRRFLFEPADTILIEKVKTLIANQIRTWEPRVAIQDIEVSIPNREDLSPEDTLENRESTLLVRIMFSEYDNIQEVDVLELSVPLGGS